MNMMFVVLLAIMGTATAQITCGVNTDHGYIDISPLSNVESYSYSQRGTGVDYDFYFNVCKNTNMKCDGMY